MPASSSVARLCAGAEFDGVDVGAPLTDDEITQIQDTFGFEFADDHRGFLAAGLPLGDRWPNWRSGDVDQLRQILSWPRAGVLFDVEHNSFWDQRWGARPGNSSRAALAVAGERLATVPQLVPVYGHRYVPAGRATRGHPVLSVHQTDVICYGVDLADYISREFGQHRPIAWTDPRGRPRPTVAFWSDLIT